MKKDFWHNVWEKDTIGFHQDDLHPFLAHDIKPYLSREEETIFVPFCGKSGDMIWLSQFGVTTGVELSDIACHDFFKENTLEYKVGQTNQDGLTLFEDTLQRIKIWQGDFFKLDRKVEDTQFSTIYDRAALIALPDTMRHTYIAKLKEFVSPQTQLFLISLDYPETEMDGPPFPVSKSEVLNHFKEYDVKEIAQHDLTGKKFARREFKVSSLIETLYLITHKSAN